MCIGGIRMAKMLKPIWFVSLRGKILGSRGGEIHGSRHQSFVLYMTPHVEKLDCVS